jgi:hypothetical protein
MAEAVRAEREPYFWCLIDTLHLTLAQRPGGLAPGEIEACDRRLANLRCVILLLTAQEATLRVRCLDGRRGNPWLDEMLRLHGGPDALVAAFLSEQRLMSAAAARLRTPVTSLPSELDPRELVEEAWKIWTGPGAGSSS